MENQLESVLGQQGRGRQDVDPVSPEVLWEGLARHIADRVSDENFAVWFSRLSPVEVRGNTLEVTAPNRFVKEWIESRYRDLLDESLAATTSQNINLSLTVRPSAERPTSIERFHPRYTFDSFVIGSSNRFAHAAALAVAEVPAKAYNPLFIYGGAGLGKTHLLHAIGRYILTFQPDLIVRYVTAEQFMNDLIVALQRRTIPEFHNLFRVADILLMDDIQFLEGKERTQEEVFHTFNALHPHSQIVITSDRPPKKLSNLENRLLTRFEWGLITDIQPPDLETRLAILQRLAEVDSLTVPGDVMSFIATRIQTSIRELEGALIRVAAYASLTRSEVNLDIAQNVLQHMLPNPTQARVTADLVISVAADYFDVSPDDILSANRTRHLVAARQIAMYLCRELTDLSLPQIGGRFGGRAHTSVIHSTNKVRQQMKERPAIFKQVRDLTVRIRQQAAEREDPFTRAR